MYTSNQAQTSPELNTELQSFINFFSDQLDRAQGVSQRLSNVSDRLRSEPCKPDEKVNTQDYPQNGLLSRLQIYGDKLMSINSQNETILNKLEQII